MFAVMLWLAVPVQANSFTETDDAGQLVDTAESPIGCGELTEINGSISASGGDNVDIYKIKITDRYAFEASLSESDPPFIQVLLKTNGDALWAADPELGSSGRTLVSAGSIIEGEYLLAISNPCVEPYDGAGNEMYKGAVVSTNGINTLRYAFGSTTLATWESACPATSGGVTVCYGWCSCDCYNGSYSITLKGATFVQTSADCDEVMMPDLVGMAREAAETEITHANLQVGTIAEQYSTIVPAGIVISQDPADGTWLVFGTIVDMEVSVGPEMTTVPNVVGMTQEEAEAEIANTNLQVGTITEQYSTIIPAGKVISQDPADGTSVVLNSTVDLVVSLGLTDPGVAPIAKTGQTTSYAQGDDGDLRMGVAWPESRFTDNLDGTVTDHLTNLMWAQDARAAGSKVWKSQTYPLTYPALEYCNNLELGGYSDWRLPNVKELLSLIDWSQKTNMLPFGHPFTNTEGYDWYSSTKPFYWYSSTSHPYQPEFFAFAVSMYNVHVQRYGKLNPCYVWPVRGGEGESAFVAKTGQTTSYAPGDDGELQMGVAWPPAPRFTDNDDGTVTDNVTGLIWLKDAQCFEKIDWTQALSNANGLENGSCGLTDGSAPGDWRLPNVKELLSLVDASPYNPVLTNGHPFTPPASASYWPGYWSSTSWANVDTKAFIVTMSYGLVINLDKVNNNNFTCWPVREPNKPPTLIPTGGGTYHQIDDPVTLGGSVSDPEGDQVTYKWLEGEEALFIGQVQTTDGGVPVSLPDYVISNLGLGNHTITLSVSDGRNDPVTCDIAVEVIDTTAPTLAPVPDKSILWPPNHGMVDIEIYADADDNSGGQVNLSATVHSNEPEAGLGDGDKAPDWTAPAIDQVNGIITFQLRAERSTSGNGRMYTTTVIATDGSGNSSSADVEILVPLDKSKK